LFAVGLGAGATRSYGRSASARLRFGALALTTWKSLLRRRRPSFATWPEFSRM